MWLMATTSFGVLIGDHVGHQWLVGGAAGLLGGQRLWNRWLRAWRAHKNSA